MIIVVKEKVDVGFANENACVAEYHLAVFDQTARVIGVGVGQQDFSNVLGFNPLRGEAFNQASTRIRTKELARAGIHQNFMSGDRNQERVNGDLGRVGLDIFREQRINLLRRCPAQQLMQILRDGPVGKRRDNDIADLHAVTARRLFNDVLGRFCRSLQHRVEKQ